MRRASLAIASLAVAGVLCVSALADGSHGRFPEDFERGVKYATVHRGNIQQDLYTDRAAIDAIIRNQLASRA